MNKIVFAAAIILMTSCVSSKKFNELTTKFQDCQDQTRNLTNQNEALSVQVAEFQSKNSKLQSDLNTLTSKYEEQNQTIESLKLKNQQLIQANADLDSQLNSLKAGSSMEISRLLEKLNQAQVDLQKREDILRAAQKELDDRSLKLQELQAALQLKDDAVKQLREKVMNALTGFNNKGLTIQEKNGKVYVSLEEQLLFKTGQWEVDPKGQQALGNLAEVLANNAEINVMVEGHTDNVPMRGTGQVKDNWDLSVMRATAVSKILLKNKGIDPMRIVAAGRGEFYPIDNSQTTEAKQKNRRTEIILTPKLDEIFKLLETN